MTGQNPALPADALVPEPGKLAPVRLAAIRVRADPGEVAGFLGGTGGAVTGDFVPLTFPFRWLSLPAIRALIVQGMGEGFLPVHEAQSFVYESCLRPGAEYILSVEVQSTEKPPRLVVTMLVSTGQGEMCARLETVLRIVPLASETPS